MYFTIEVFGFTLLRIGVGSGPKPQWITNTDGHFELAPDEEYEEYEEEDCFGFR